MKNARNGGIYDFKVRGIGDLKGNQAEKYKYRGMPIDGVVGFRNGKRVFGSGRDVGNVGAGYVAGNYGMSWGVARLGIDTYQSKKSGTLTTEGAPTQAAERAGFNLGQKDYSGRVRQIQLQNAKRIVPFGPK